MRIAKVFGHVTLSRCHPTFIGAQLKLCIPMSFDELDQRNEPQGDSLVAWDQLGAGNGSLIGLSEGPEASQPFRPDVKPVDAYAAAILDHIDIEKPTE